jgi:hypothetical protein
MNGLSAGVHLAAPAVRLVEVAARGRRRLADGDVRIVFEQRLGDDLLRPAGADLP